MNAQQWIVFSVLLATLVMFIWNRWRHDMVAAGALLACVLAGLVSYSNAFDGFSHPAVITVACVLVLSKGLQNSGVVDVLVRHVIPASAGPMLTIAALAGIAAALSGFINNVGALALLMPVAMQAAAVMCPITISTARQLGVSADPFLMAVAVGASCAFLTPIGHQSNTLVMAPGGYRFGDYWRMGLPLSILAVAAAVPLILWFWPP
ncbi:MAG: anion permease [Deltaproteobacteria bacterium]|nr:anion permease [Deltaproteobacteria bacterium]